MKNLNSDSWPVSTECMNARSKKKAEEIRMQVSEIYKKA